MQFEWDEKKAISNLAKHDVAFDEASTVFGDPLSLTILEPLHSQEEDRFVTIGMSTRAHTLVVVHTDRGDRVRIISARRATRHEVRDYERGV